MFRLHKTSSIKQKKILNIFVYIFMAFAYTSSYASSKFMGDEDVFLEVIFADEDGDGVDNEDDACAYSWKVVAVDANGNKSNSGVYSFRTN